MGWEKHSILLCSMSIRGPSGSEHTSLVIHTFSLSGGGTQTSLAAKFGEHYTAKSIACCESHSESHFSQQHNATNLIQITTTN